MIGSNLLVILLFLIKSFLEHKDVKISGCIVCIEEPHYLGSDLLLTKILVLKYVLDIILYLVISRINAQTINFILCLRQTSEKGVFLLPLSILCWDIFQLILWVVNHIFLKNVEVCKYLSVMVLIHIHISINWVKFTILSFVLSVSIKIWMNVFDFIMGLITDSIASIALLFLNWEVLNIKLLVRLVSNVSQHGCRLIAVMVNFFLLVLFISFQKLSDCTALSRCLDVSDLQQLIVFHGVLDLSLQELVIVQCGILLSFQFIHFSFLTL